MGAGDAVSGAAAFLPASIHHLTPMFPNTKHAGRHCCTTGDTRRKTCKAESIFTNTKHAGTRRSRTLRDRNGSSAHLVLSKPRRSVSAANTRKVVHLSVCVPRLDGLGGHLRCVVRRKHHVGLGAGDSGCCVCPRHLSRGINNQFINTSENKKQRAI